MRVHIALKTTTSQGDGETGCISLVGMFVFVALRPADGGCLASVRKEGERGKMRERVSRDHWLCGTGTEGLAGFDLEEASDR